MRKFVFAHSPFDTFRNLFLSFTRTERLSNPFDFPIVFPGAFGILPPHLTAAGGAQDNAGGKTATDTGESPLGEIANMDELESVAGVEVQRDGVDVIGGTVEASTVDAELPEVREPGLRRVPRPTVDLATEIGGDRDAFRHEVDGSGEGNGDPNSQSSGGDE